APGAADSRALFALVDRLKETRWPKFPGAPAGRSLATFLEGVAKQANMVFVVNEKALKDANMPQSRRLQLKAVPALAGASIHTVLSSGLRPLGLTWLPRMSEDGSAHVEVLPDSEAPYVQYTILHDVRDLMAKGARAQNLVTAIRQSVGQ